MTRNIFYFNPTCELAIANGSFSYMPPRLLRDFEKDCSVLPFLFADSDDFILTETKPSHEFIQKLTEAGFVMPFFATMNELMTESSFNRLYPWGWSPSTHFILKSLKEKCSFEFKNSPVFNWNDAHQKLFERKTSLDFLVKLLENHPLAFFIEKEKTGVILHHIEEIEMQLNQQSPLVLKAPLSSSGRGIQIIRKADLNTSNRQWISGVLNQQGYLVAEPFLNKITDLSFQFSINDLGEPEYLGYSIFETNTNGQYKSSRINPLLKDFLPVSFLDSAEKIIEITAQLLTHHLKHSIYATWHRGFLGIDVLFYKDEQGLKLQPCIEINSRMNMGILTMQIEKHIHPEAPGKFALFYGRKSEYEQYARQMNLEKPLKLENGRIKSGFLALTEPDPTKQFGAYLLLD